MRILVLLVLAMALLGSSVNLAAQEAILLGRISQPNVGGMKSAHDSRVTFSRIAWYFRPSPPTECSFKLERSPLGVTWTDLTPLIDCSSEGKAEFIVPIIEDFIRVNVPVFVKPDAGFVSFFWEGFTGEKCGKDYDGIFSTVVGTNPVAGAELSITVPSNERWRVYSASFRLQTDSTVVDREVFLTASDNGSEYFRVFADGVVKADQEGIFTAAALGFVGTTGLGPSSIHQPADVRTILIPIYSDAFIPGGHTLATDTNGLQSGDDYNPVVVLVERCPN